MRKLVSLTRFSTQCIVLANVPSENTKWSWDGSFSHLSQGTCTRLTSSAFTRIFRSPKMPNCPDVWCNEIIWLLITWQKFIGGFVWLLTTIFDPFSFSPYSPAGASRPRAELLPGGHEAGGCGPEKSPFYLSGHSRCIAWRWGAGHLWWLARSVWLLLPLWLTRHLPCWLVRPYWRQSSATWHQRSEPRK